MNKEQTERIVEYFADKTLSLGCRIKHNKEGELIYIETGFCQNEEHDGEYACKNSDYCNNLCCFRLSDGKVIYGNHWTPYEILGHPIMLGDVLEKIDALEVVLPGKETVHVLAAHWKACGTPKNPSIKKSLQTILSEAEWEYLCPDCKSLGHGCCPEGGGKASMEVLKSPAKELFEFLYTFLPEKE